MEFVSIILFWVLLVAAVLSRGPFIFYLLFGSMAFGSFAVIPPALTQGLSFTPPPIIALVIIFIYGGGKNGLSRMLGIAMIGAVSQPVTHWLLGGYREERATMVAATSRVFLGVINGLRAG